MKKNSIAAALMAMSAAASVHAQSSVTMYGIADVGLVGESGGKDGRVTKITSGPAATSRLGFRGNEDLGGGLSAFFILEGGFKLDTGVMDSANTPFNRQALVGLRSSAGTLSLGRQNTPYHNTLVAVADPFATGYSGTSKNAFPDWGTNVRTSNTVLYATPDYKGFSGDIAYAAGEQPGDASANRQIGASAGYVNGPLNVRFAYNNRHGDNVSTGTATNKLLAANYDFIVAKLYFALGIDQGYNSAPLGNTANPYGGVAPTPSTDGREFLLGATMPLSTGTFIASVMHKDDRTAFNQDANTWGLGYIYPLSKRTSLYASYGRIYNRNGAGYTVANNSESGSGDKAYSLGMRHNF